MIVLTWSVLGGLFALGIRKRVSAIGARRKAEYVLGEYAESLGLAVEATEDSKSVSLNGE
jgi:hypothetical protein